MEDTERTGYCGCGCGQKTSVATKTDRSTDRIKGRPMKFIRGHSSFKGGIVDRGGRIGIYNHEHPRQDFNGYVPRYVLVVEKVMGKPLRKDAIVHHVDEDPLNDTPSNLVACENHAYHMLLHQRIRAYKACGYASWKKCSFCGEYSHPENPELCITTRGSAWHRSCHNLEVRLTQRVRNNKDIIKRLTKQTGGI